jgi:hypothetical protein
MCSMGGTTRRLAYLVGLAIGVIILAPGSAGAVTIGTHNIGAQPDFGTGCDGPGDCILLQTKLPGAKVRAPFSGRIRKWRVATPGINEYQLVVMRKRDGGKFKAVSASLTENTTGAGTYSFATNLRIKKGDYVGVLGISFQGLDNSDARRALFNPPLALGGIGKPTNRVPGELLYNATVKRPG